MSGGNGAHILVFPYPAQGHMLPILDLTHQLALRGLTITILLTPKNLPIINPLLSAHHPSSIQTLIFPFPHHPSLPSHVENVKDIGNAGNLPIINALRKLHDPIIQWFHSHPNPPVAIISDFFLGWTQHVATQIGIPRLCFYSSGPFLGSVSNYLWDHMKEVRSLSEVTFPDLPHSPTFLQEHLPSMFRRYIESDPEWELFKDGYFANNLSWASVFNTFDALEGEYLEYWRNSFVDSRVFGVGPLSLLGGSDEMGRGETDSDSNSKQQVLTWLDQFPDGSVVYVCFGSQKLLKAAQIEALADGLERSGTRFIWVIKPPTPDQVEKGYGSVPDGFEERVAGRGVVINGWAPQVSILGHRAVGGFLSHCGWNSVLEGIVGGVMILGWPMEADQFVNAKLLVEYMGAAVRVCEGPDTVPDPVQLGRVIGESMKGVVTEKVRAKEVRKKAIEAVKPGGSSLKDLEALVTELSKLQTKKNSITK